MLHEEEILVWAIPPLSPQLPDFFDHNPTLIPSLCRIAFPDGIIRDTELVGSQTMVSLVFWLFATSLLCSDSKLHTFEIIIKPDLFDTSLHIINTELIPHDFDITFRRYSICEDTLVACSWNYYLRQLEVYMRSRLTTAISHGGPAAKVLVLPLSANGYRKFLSPASGRYVYLNDDICGIVVVDLI